MINVIIANFAKFFPEINSALGAGILVFVRFLGLMRFAPVLNRKEIPGIVKLSFSLIFTVILVSVLNPPAPPQGVSLIYSVIINFVFGALMGYVANCIMSAIEAGGDMINMQMGLSSSMVLDPTTQSQVSILGKFIGLLGILIFMNIGGLYWIFNAFLKKL
jgi:flagellar biosynthetic protein FliR